MNATKILTTGQLRQFLVDAIVGVKNGHLDIDKASRITKMAQQVNESFYSELKSQVVQKSMGVVSVASLGETPINIAEK